ncbi:MAG: LemA family protein [Bacteroidales bacterium]|nr:LemA family protein [Bacteroidales bacterium]MBR1678379.1 LemA family protein [Bacteroidales bacterium]
MSTTLVIVIAVVALLVLWGISVQNKLVQSDELCNNALKQINVQQVSRYDALEALVKLTREYASYESETLQKVIAQRKITASANPTVEEVNANEAALKDISARLIAIAERYPDLKANENYRQTMQSIEKYEENVRLSRMTFNDTVTRFNNQVRMFPASLIAGLLGFAKRDYLAEDTSKKDYPKF